MKKAWILMLTVVLLLLCCAFAGAEEIRETDLFDLWDYGGESPVWTGSAVPISEGVVITSSAMLPKNTDYLVVSDGKEQWEAEAVMSDSEGKLMLVLFDAEKKPSRYGTWPLMPMGTNTAASSCVVRFGDALGSRINRAVLNAEETEWMGRHCYLMTLSDAAPAGSPVLTEDGQLAAIVAAQYAEGMNRVLALPADEIAESLTEVAAMLNNLPDWSEKPEGLTVTLDRNAATIDWSGMTLPEKAENEKLYLIVADAGNSYLNYYPAEVSNRTLKTILTPGRLYVAGVKAYSGIPDSLPDKYIVFNAAPVKRLTDHSFRPILTAVAESQGPSLKEGETPVPVTEVTLDLLRSGRAWFYSSSTYEVTEEINDGTLLVTLTDPQGVNYRWESSWVYSPAYMEGDIWYISLRDSGLLSFLENRNQDIRGVFQMAYYVNGDLADCFEFELK